MRLVWAGWSDRHRSGGRCGPGPLISVAPILHPGGRPIESRDPRLNRQYLEPTRNLVLPESGSVSSSVLAYEADEGWWEVLAETGLGVVVSREYEHLVVAMSWAEGPWLSHLELPHPSGLWWDATARTLYLSSTRWPNQIIEFLTVDRDTPPSDLHPPEVPALDDRALLVPVRSWFLPGSLDIHEVGMLGRDVVFTATGHNFLGRLLPEGGWRRLWWPAALDRLDPAAGRRPFDERYFQLNGMAVGTELDGFLFTAFSDHTTGPKPWKAGYGPRGKGVVFSGRSREVVARGLTCPHSVRWWEGVPWLCDSGYGTVGFLDGSGYVPVLSVPGFTRGLAFHGRHGFVGLSKIIPKYDSYAPGVESGTSLCGVVAFDVTTGREVGRLVWPEGYQVFDVQLLAGVAKPFFPPVADQREGNKAFLMYYGRDGDAGRRAAAR